MTKPLPLHAAALAVALAFLPQAAAQRQMEWLDRGLVAIHDAPGSIFLIWRFLGTDPGGISFDVYRATNGGEPERLNEQPLTRATNYRDNGADMTKSQVYSVRTRQAGLDSLQDAPFAFEANAPVRPYLEIPLQTPPGYTPNDGSVGDLTGDGRYEIIVKMERATRDNSQAGRTDPTYLHAYTLDGRLLWQINLGINIRSGPHYTQFLVYDFDGDGRAEMVCRTADGAVDGLGAVIGDPTADWRNQDGYVLAGPEFLTVFDGTTGAALATVPFIPPRHPDTLSPTSVQLNDVWGDGHGNRVDRFLAGVAYLDGKRPSILMSRGYYTRTVIAAWDWRDGRLGHRWTFDSDDGRPGNRAYRGQGNHSLAIADVNGDGRDDIVFGAMTVAHDGTGMHSTGWGHGDALHVTRMDPDDSRVMAFMPHETPRSYGPNAISLRDAASGALILGVEGADDIGRGAAMDIDPRFPGYEMWASGSVSGLYNVRSFRPDTQLGPRGIPVSSNRPLSINFGIWWTGDLLRELLDRTQIEKWDWNQERTVPLLSATGAASNNGTKATPVLSADILGDWREEVVWRSADNKTLRIYTTPHPTEHRIHTLMHDPAYRAAVAWQNIGYNQPPHPGFFLGHGMSKPPQPDIVTPRLRP